MKSKTHLSLERDRVEDDPLWAEAASWFVEMRSELVSAERIAEWLRWLDQDPKHQTAFDAIASLSGRSHQLNPRWPSEREVAADDYGGEESISRWRGQREIAKAVRGWRQMTARKRNTAITATLALVTLGLLTWLFAPTLSAALHGGARLALSTDVGEMRTLALPDGSLVTAGGQTALVAVVGKDSRRLTLDHGEIFVRVAKDRTRPFTVRAAGTAVTAVGTAFDVRRIQSEALVAVAEGIVRVSAVSAGPGGAGSSASSSGVRATQNESELLRAGQQWRLDGSGAAAEVSAVDPDWVGGWRQERLQYLDEPLERVIEDLGRYSHRRIQLKDRQVAQLRMTGVVFPHDLDAWLSSLQVSLPVRVLYGRDGGIEIAQK